ncbi:MAG: 50S ribosomal protein L18 [Candidatus Omnitrophota bacterium]|nr:50S ribosomal protein L18 [Candidatus Omnitrophota bacterium]
MNKKTLTRLKRRRRIRLKLHGTAQRPRLVIQRSLKNLGAQVIDDSINQTLFSYSTTNKEIRQKIPATLNLKTAEIFGQIFAQKAKEKGVTKIIFDRAGYLYHGKVKAFAEALQKGGLEF